MTNLPLGGPMDPMTLRMAAEPPTQAEKAQATTALEIAAGFLPVSESDAAKRLMDLVEESLFGVIAGFLETDPTCRAMLTILQNFNDSRNIARRAVQRLMNPRP